MILLTGASGYLGQHVAGLLESRSIEYQSSSWRVFRNPFAEALDDQWPVIHCAAIVPRQTADYGDANAAIQSVGMVNEITQIPALSPMVYASSLAAERPTTAYAYGKRLGEMLCRRSDVILRLPGLFGLPRRSGVIYESALNGDIKDSYGPSPAMHVADAAEYLVRAATMPSDGNPEPFSVTYGDPRLEACYGSLGVTFQQRVQELVEQVREVRA